MRTSGGLGLGLGQGAGDKALAPLGHCALVPIGSESESKSESDLQSGISPTMARNCASTPRRTETETETEKFKFYRCVDGYFYRSWGPEQIAPGEGQERGGPAHMYIVCLVQYNTF